MSSNLLTYVRRREVAIGLSLGVLCLVAVGVWYLRNGKSSTEKHGHQGVEVRLANHTEPALAPGEVELPQASWKSAEIEIQPVARLPLAMTVELTGKIGLNEDKVAHIFPMIEGRVEQVDVHLGEQVRRGQRLLVMQSKEVGQAKLQLYEDRLRRDFAVTKDKWMQAVTTNTRELISLIRAGSSMTEIEKQLTNRPIGEFREQLMSAYVNLYKSQKTVERLSPLAQDKVVAGKQILEAETNQDTSRATLQSLIEQTEKDAEQASKTSAQLVKELQTRVTVDEANLKILGFKDSDLTDLNPAVQGEAISHCEVVAPFDGTVISKDVVLLENVKPDRQILRVADLSTVWVTADIFEEQLPMIRNLEKQTIHLRSKSWPDKKFDAKIFYTGDVVDEASRTVSLRAMSDNQEGLLKPGMFVSIDFPSVTPTAVTQVPLAAIQEHAGKSLVFVHVGGDKFQRRDVVLGRRNGEAVEVVSGLADNEQVVVRGGFALKTRLLAELLGE